MRCNPKLIAATLKTACWPVLATAQGDEKDKTETMNWFSAFIWSPTSPILGNVIVILLLMMSAVVMGFSLMLIFKFRRNTSGRASRGSEGKFLPTGTPPRRLNAWRERRIDLPLELFQRPGGGGDA